MQNSHQTLSREISSICVQFATLGRKHTSLHSQHLNVSLLTSTVCTLQNLHFHSDKHTMNCKFTGGTGCISSVCISVSLKCCALHVCGVQTVHTKSNFIIANIDAFFLIQRDSWEGGCLLFLICLYFFMPVTYSTYTDTNCCKMCNIIVNDVHITINKSFSRISFCKMSTSHSKKEKKEKKGETLNLSMMGCFSRRLCGCSNLLTWPLKRRGRDSAMLLTQAVCPRRKPLKTAAIKARLKKNNLRFSK